MNPDMVEAFADPRHGSLAPDTLFKYTNKEYLISYQNEHLNMPTLGDNAEFISPFTQLGHPVTPVKFIPKHRVEISDLMEKIESPILGKFLLCRIITPSFQISAIHTIVDDPAGLRAIRLVLYNYASDEVDLGVLLPVGLILAVKNPWFKSTLDGGLVLRCDDPTNVFVVKRDIMASIFPGLEWKSEVPVEFSGACAFPIPTAPTDSVLDLKNHGNRNFVQGNFQDAIRFYSRALEICPKFSEVLANRAAAFLNLRCHSSAVRDTTRLLEFDPNNIKGIFRHVKGLWGIGNYPLANSFITWKLKSSDFNWSEDLMELRNTADILLKQNLTGNFDILRFLDSKEEKILEVAEYMGPLKLKKIEGRGRGLVADDAIKAGQLLISSKAFAIQHWDFSYDGKIAFQESIKAASEGLVKLITQKLTLDPCSALELFRLCSGHVPEGTTRTDLQRIEHIININAFLRTDELVGGPPSARRQTLGLWIQPSFINHSCSEANSYWDICGDVMFIRAVKPIRRGDEILISYIEPNWPYASRQKTFEQHLFICRCTICRIQCLETEEVAARRVFLLKELRQFGEMASAMDVRKVFSLVDELETLQPINPRFHMSFADPAIEEIGRILFELKHYTKSVELFKKSHFVTKGTGLSKVAVRACLNIFESLIKEGNVKELNKWLDILRNDLIVAYGSVQALHVIGPETVKLLDRIGWKSFL